MIERTRAGLAAAAANGRKSGRPRARSTLPPPRRRAACGTRASPQRKSRRCWASPVPRCTATSPKLPNEERMSKRLRSAAFAGAMIGRFACRHDIEERAQRYPAAECVQPRARDREPSRAVFTDPPTNPLRTASRPLGNVTDRCAKCLRPALDVPRSDEEHSHQLSSLYTESGPDPARFGDQLYAANLLCAVVRRFGGVDSDRGGDMMAKSEAPQSHDTYLRAVIDAHGAIKPGRHGNAADRAAHRQVRSAIEAARDAGVTWMQIGELLGIARGNAYQQYRRRPAPRIA
jgi:hypothetical protein